MKIIKKTIEKRHYAPKNPVPSIFVNEPGQNRSNLSVRIWSPSDYWLDAKVELLWKFVQTLRTIGIVIQYNRNVICIWRDQTMYGSHAFKAGFTKYSQSIALDKKQQFSKNCTSGGSNDRS